MPLRPAPVHAATCTQYKCVHLGAPSSHLRGSIQHLCARVDAPKKTFNLNFLLHLSSDPSEGVEGPPGTDYI